MSAIPAPTHSPPETWPDEEFDLPPGVDLFSYSRNRSSLASQLTWDDSEAGSASVGSSPVKQGDDRRSSVGVGGSVAEEDEDDWAQDLPASPPAKQQHAQRLSLPFTGSITRLGSASPAPAQPVAEDEGFDFSDAPPPSALKLKLRLPSPAAAELDWDDDDGKANTLKPVPLPTNGPARGLGLRNIPPLGKGIPSMRPTTGLEEDDFEAAFALEPEVSFLSLPATSSPHSAKTSPAGKGLTRSDIEPDEAERWNDVTHSTALSPAPSSLFHASPHLSLNTPSTSTSAASSQGDSMSCPGSPVPSASTGPSTQGDLGDFLPELHESPLSSLPPPRGKGAAGSVGPSIGEQEEDDEADILFPAHLTASGMRAILERRKAQAEAESALLSPRSQADDEPFEHGLLIVNDDELSPSRLRAARAANAQNNQGSRIPIASSRQPSAQGGHRRPHLSSRESAPSAFLSPPPTQPRTVSHASAHSAGYGQVAEMVNRRKSASRLQSPSPAGRPGAPAGGKAVIKRKASLGTMLPSSSSAAAAAVAAAGGHGRKKPSTGGSNSSASSAELLAAAGIPPVPPLPANISPTASLRRPPSAGSSSILSPRSPSPAPSLPGVSSGSSGKGSHGPASGSGTASSGSSSLTKPTQSSLAKGPSQAGHRTQPTRRGEPPQSSAGAGLVPKRTPPRQRGKLAGLWPGVSPTTSQSSIGSPAPQGRSAAEKLKEREEKQREEKDKQPGPVARLLRKPRGIERRGRVWGTGKELDGIEDLPVGKDEQPLKSPTTPGTAPSSWGNTIRKVTGREPSPNPAVGKGTVGRGMYALKQGPSSGAQQQPSKIQPQPQTPAAKRQTDPQPPQPLGVHAQGHAKVKEPPRPKSRTSPGRIGEKENARGGEKGRKGPTLIRDLGSVGLPRTQNGMKWNPSKQRWDGQEHLLKVFDPPLSARPALITHLSTSGSSPLFKTLGLTGAAVGAMRVVGEMMFDPVEMRWLRRDGAEEEDVFKHVEEESSVGSEFAIDREREALEMEPGTIRPGGRTSALSQIPLGGIPVDPDLVKQCKDAEARHRSELAGWLQGMESSPASPVDEDDEAEAHRRRWLWDIRALATQTPTHE